jgi:hypothetical protein
MISVFFFFCYVGGFFRRKYLYLFFSIKFRKLNIMLNNFIFPNFFRTFIVFSLLLGFLICLCCFLSLLKEL